MSGFTSITLREVEPADLEVFYVHQLDPEAVRMVRFVSRDKAAFDTHWAKILKSPQNTNRTIVAGGHVAGYVACFPLGDDLHVAYWLGRESWGKGIATAALRQMLHLITVRPLFACVATHNVGSVRVLQKCGFKITAEHPDSANGPGEETKEYLLRLDPSV